MSTTTDTTVSTPDGAITAGLQADGLLARRSADRLAGKVAVVTGGSTATTRSLTTQRVEASTEPSGPPVPMSIESLPRPSSFLGTASSAAKLSLSSFATCW